MGTEAAVPQVIDKAGHVVLATKAPKLSPKKRAFCHAYVSSWNLKKAVAAAGITALPGFRSLDPLRIGQQLLSENGVQSYMDWIKQNAANDHRPSNSWLREQTIALAGADISDALVFGEPDPEGFRPLKTLRLDKIDGRIISGLDFGYDDKGQPKLKLKFHPKLEAQKMLWQEAGMLGENAQAPAVVIFNYGNVEMPK